MSPDTLLVFGILIATIILFMSERLRLDLVALFALLALMLTKLLTPAEALAGFADPIVLMIAGLFVVGGGLFQTGVAESLGIWLGRLAGKDEVRLVVVIMLVVAIFSAFMSSTGATAILLPIVVNLAWKAKINPSKLLMPLAFGSLIGGMLTLIGTPPNIVVSNQLASQGLEPFGFFTFTPVGLVMLVVGVIFMALLGRRMLSDRASRGAAYASASETDSLSLSDLAEAYHLPDSLFRLRVRRNSPLIGFTLAEADLRSRYDVNVLEIQSWPDVQPKPAPARPVEPCTVLEPHDILHVQGAAEDVSRLAQEMVMGIRPVEDFGGRFLSKELGLVEVLLTPRSSLIGRTLQETRFRDKYNVTVLSIKRLGEQMGTEVATCRLRFGDTLLVQGTWEKIDLLREERRDLVIVGQPYEMIEAQRPTGRAPIAIAIMVGMLVLMTFSIVPAVTAVLLAAAAMVLTGCLTMDEGYNGINWQSIVLIAAMLPMATALEKTGGISLVANGLTSSLGQFGPLALMAGLFIITTVFSQFISNTAATVLIAPIAYQVAISLDLRPHAFLMVIAVAASASFATPIGSANNMLVLGPGGYRFSDFVKVGIPLQILIMLATLIVVPALFPF